jgi:hypothetical protein
MEVWDVPWDNRRFIGVCKSQAPYGCSNSFVKSSVAMNESLANHSVGTRSLTNCSIISDFAYNFDWWNEYLLKSTAVNSDKEWIKRYLRKKFFVEANATKSVYERKRIVRINVIPDELVVELEKWFRSTKTILGLF